MPANVQRVRDYVQHQLQYSALVAWRTRDFWVRALLCWVFGAVLLANDEAGNYDLRLKIRGERPSTSPIVLVDLTERDWLSLDPESRNVLRSLKEIVSLTDAYFWNSHIWGKLLGRILQDNPSAVGVTFFFGDNVRSSRVDEATRQIFTDPRLIWGADSDTSGRLLVPLYALPHNSNIGTRVLHHDDDGTVRRFNPNSGYLDVPPLAVRLAAIAHPDLKPVHGRELQLINYIGDQNSFTVVNAKDIIEGRLPAGALDGKVVLIGSLGGALEETQTPIGRMSRSEVIANTVDNLLRGDLVTRFPNWFYLLLLGGLMAATIQVLIAYPQSVSLVIFVLAGMTWTALSVWAFDVAHIWLPVFSPLVQLAVTCIVFLSYQLAVNERRTWRLEQEQRYLSEIEQLKTNFVSMMSHDLKTPIAKIQAICDRLIATDPVDDGRKQDLLSLRRSSVELHRYIQSILQVTKVEAKDFRIQKQVTDMNENIEAVITRLKPLAQEKGVSLETELEPMFSIEADQGLIQEVVHNLIENAIKYSAASPVARVRVVSQEKDDNVVVVVEDTGPGIDPEDQKEIWKKFTRGRNQIRLASGGDVRGTGLGLYLVKYFVELHGGHVFLESELGRGTKIGFSIPVAEDASPPVSGSASDGESAATDPNGSSERSST